MGFFDESSSSDDDDNQAAAAASPPENAGNDDVDPLDAYMNSLQQEEEEPTSHTTTKNRLDWENEEEEAESSYYGSGIEPSNQQEEEEQEYFSQNQLEARQAMESTFCKATTPGKQQQQTLPITSKKPTGPLEPIQKSFWTVTDTEQGRQWRREHHVHITSSSSSSHSSKRGIGSTDAGGGGASCSNIDPITSFELLADVFGPALLQQVRSNYTTPTAVQSQTLPAALSGRDAIITAATGQGKTLAYLWPLAVHVSHQPPLQWQAAETGPMAVVLVPTRELAQQVQKQAKAVLQALGDLTSRCVIGGQGKYILRQELKKAGGGVNVVIATPGRLLDVLSDKKGLSLQRVTFVVLDEADKMLNMGFEAQVRQILQNIRTDRQTLMLSATMGRKMEKVASEWLSRAALRISVGRTGESSQNVEQHVMVLPNEAAKEAFLLEMIPIFSQVGRTIVFVATREGCERLATLAREQTPATKLQTLHGDKHQSDRNAAVRAFTRGDISVLIATDVAARGLDIPNVQTVLSFDPAKNLDGHVHRVGRAGRLSKETNEQQVGSAYTLLTTKNADFAHVLRNAFEREGRTIPPTLLGLAKTSRRSGNVVSRSKGNKAGLGYHHEADSPVAMSQQYVSKSSNSRSANAASDLHYGTSGGVPPAKRSRWT